MGGLSHQLWEDGPDMYIKQAEQVVVTKSLSSGPHSSALVLASRFPPSVPAPRVMVVITAIENKLAQKLVPESWSIVVKSHGHIVWGKVAEGFGIFVLERPLSALISLSCSRKLEDRNFEREADDGDLA